MHKIHYSCHCSVGLYLQLFVGGFVSYLRCSVGLYLQLFVGGFVSYLRCSVGLYLQLFVGGFVSYLRCSVGLYLQLFVGGFVSYLFVFVWVPWCPTHVVLYFSFVFFVLCTVCCQFLWIVHFWLPLQYFSNVYWRWLKNQSLSDTLKIYILQTSLWR